LLSHLYSLTAWSRRHKGKQRIYAVVEPDRERGTSGKYKSVQGITIHEIRALYVVRDSQSNMDAQPNGLVYKAGGKFLVAFSELTRIGVIPTQPNLMIAMEGAGMLRVADVAREDNAQLWKLTCDKVRDDFPILAAGWDLAGEAPIGWVASDPAVVVFDGQLTITNVPTPDDSNPSIHVDLQESIHAPAIIASFSMKCTCSLTDNLPAAFILLGKTPDKSADGLLIEVEVIDGALCITCEDNTFEIVSGEWVDISLDEDQLTVGDNDPVTVVPPAANALYLMFSGYNVAEGEEPDVGAVATTLFKDVEVSCNHAI